MNTPLENSFMSDNQCYCQSQKSYQDCCEPLHLSAKNLPLTAKPLMANSAEQLMRSRYSAFVLADVHYIVATTLPTQQKLLEINSIESWAKETDWVGLEVMAHHEKLSKRHAKVEFKAFYNLNNCKSFHHELSTFVKVTDKKTKQAAWFFIDPNALDKMTITQKQPCICGSGEKFKRCCAQFI